MVKIDFRANSGTWAFFFIWQEAAKMLITVIVPDPPARYLRPRSKFQKIAVEPEWKARKLLSGVFGGTFGQKRGINNFRSFFFWPGTTFSIECKIGISMFLRRMHCARCRARNVSVFLAAMFLGHGVTELIYKCILLARRIRLLCCCMHALGGATTQAIVKQRGNLSPIWLTGQ